MLATAPWIGFISIKSVTAQQGFLTLAGTAAILRQIKLSFSDRRFSFMFSSAWIAMEYLKPLGACDGTPWLKSSGARSYPTMPIHPIPSV
jgi:hypothetical protein